ncbi:MAG: helix-turn-helix domain-containing protein [Lachnospiraceae bacterium]|nr:helix-turn-helix domain-containing protein [Lachnospiraceae bacterium]
MASSSNSFADRIKELRKKTGLSQSKFSAKFGIPVRTLQQWEQGISAPPEYLVRMMAYIMHSALFIMLPGSTSVKDRNYYATHGR